MREFKVTFVPANKSHHALLRSWFATPHVKQWWPDGGDVLANLKAGLETENCSPYVAFHLGEPVAYIQSWVPSVTQDYPWQAALEPTARGIDMFIGSAENLGLGLGPGLIAAFVEKLRDKGATRILIDPDVGNARAIRAYEKAGFRQIGKVRDIDGESLLMELTS